MCAITCSLRVALEGSWTRSPKWSDSNRHSDIGCGNLKQWLNLLCHNTHPVQSSGRHPECPSTGERLAALRYCLGSLRYPHFKKEFMALAKYSSSMWGRQQPSKLSKHFKINNGPKQGTLKVDASQRSFISICMEPRPRGRKCILSKTLGELVSQEMQNSGLPFRQAMLLCYKYGFPSQMNNIT